MELSAICLSESFRGEAYPETLDVNAPFVTQIFGHLIKMLSRKNVTDQ